MFQQQKKQQPFLMLNKKCFSFAAKPDFTKCNMFLNQHLCWPWNNIVINQSDLFQSTFKLFQTYMSFIIITVQVGPYEENNLLIKQNEVFFKYTVNMLIFSVRGVFRSRNKVRG